MLQTYKPVEYYTAGTRPCPHGREATDWLNCWQCLLFIADKYEERKQFQMYVLWNAVVQDIA